MKPPVKCAIATAVAVLLIAAVVLPVSRSCDIRGEALHHGHGSAMKGMHLFHDLDLTDDQKKEVATIVTEYRKDLQPMVDRAIDDHDAIKDLFHEKTFDEAAVREQIREMHRQNEDLIVTFGKMLRDIRPVLTADQLQKIEKFHADPPGMGIRGHIGHIQSFIDHVLDEWSK